MPVGEGQLKLHGETWRFGAFFFLRGDTGYRCIYWLAGGRAFGFTFRLVWGVSHHHDQTSTLEGYTG